MVRYRISGSRKRYKPVIVHIFTNFTKPRIHRSITATRIPMTQILAIDIGGSQMRAAPVFVSNIKSNIKLNFEVGDSVQVKLPQTMTPVDILGTLDKLCTPVFARYPLHSFDRIGMTIPGLADSRTWIYAPFSGIGNFPIAAILREKYQKPVFVENDVNACAWAEKIFGVCQSVNDFLWITISNGIGGGLILNGKIYPGTFGGSAEIGHFNIVENGALCGCGNRGCLEAEAAGPGIARRFEEMLAQNGGETQQRVDLLKWKKRIPAGYTLAAAEIAELARMGDPIAQEVYNLTGYYVGRAAAFAANLINPACVVIGGGVSGAFDLLETEMKKTFYAQVFHDANKDVKILKTGLGYEAGLYAAASLIYLD